MIQSNTEKYNEALKEYEAVSYTNLDVYKRQILYRTKNNYFLFII